MRKIVIKYILTLLEYQETILKCVNLGFNQDKHIKVELDLIKEAKELIKELK